MDMDEDLMPIEQTWAEAMRGCAPGDCLEAEALLELAEKGRRARSYSLRMGHVALCRTCRETLKLLQQTERARPTRRCLWPFALPVAAPVLGWSAALAAVALGLWLLQSQSGGPEPAPLAGHDRPMPAPPAPGASNPLPLPPDEERGPLDLPEPEESPAEAPRSPRRTPRRAAPSKEEAPEERPEAISPAPGSLYADSAPGILEGEVLDGALVLHGEVVAVPSLEGEVVPASTVGGEVVAVPVGQKPPPPGGRG
jgi:hypothetical protein